MQNLSECALHFAATPYGVVQDRNVHLAHGAFERLQAWLSQRGDDPVATIEHAEAQVTLTSNAADRLALEADRPIHLEMGGNTLNTWTAFDATMRALDAEHFGEGVLHAHDTPELLAALGDEPPANVILQTMEGARVRINYVFANGDSPLYVAMPERPTPKETGDLNFGGDVFVSSAGADLYHEMGRFKGQRLRLAPGRAQCARGIPLETLRRVHFITCNEAEALQLAGHLQRELETMEMDPTKDAKLESARAFLYLLDSYPSDISRQRTLLTTAFNLAGIPEVRVTCEKDGIALVSGGKYKFYPAISREDPIIQELLSAHPSALPGYSDGDGEVVANGCGDTRVGCELACEKWGADLPTRIYFGAIMATLNTFNPRPNIRSFPPELIRAAFVKAQEMAGVWPVREEEQRVEGPLATPLQV